MKLQAIKCKCGSIIAASVNPDYYKDKEWNERVKKARKEGYEIVGFDTLGITLCICKCPKPIFTVGEIPYSPPSGILDDKTQS